MRLSTNYASLLMISQKMNLFILQDIWELCFILLCETLHEIRAISNRDLDRNISDNKEKSTVKAMGESILTGFNPRPWLSLFWEFKNSMCLLVYSQVRSEHLPPHLCAYHVCCFSGRQHLVGSVVCHFWLFWLDCPTSWRRRQPIHLCHMPCIKGCIDHSGHWLWPGLYWPVRKAMEVNQVLGWTKSHISTLTVITIYEST